MAKRGRGLPSTVELLIAYGEQVANGNMTVIQLKGLMDEIIEHRKSVEETFGMYHAVANLSNGLLVLSRICRFFDAEPHVSVKDTVNANSQYMCWLNMIQNNLNIEDDELFYPSKASLALS